MVGVRERAEPWVDHWLAEAGNVMFYAYIRHLPRLNLVSAIALARALITATDGVPRLSEPILRARRLLETRLDYLAARVWGQDMHPWAEHTPLALAGQTLDAAWMGMHDWLGALATIPPPSPTSRAAVELLVKIFPEGVGLVRPPPLLEWAESEARLARIDKSGSEAALCSLGGGEFVKAIRVAHEQFVDTLGPMENGAWSSRELKRGLDSVVLAIHAYVTSVIAELFEGGPESIARANALLGPLDLVSSRGTGRSAYFDQTLEAHPPPPVPMFVQENVPWTDDPLDLVV